MQQSTSQLLSFRSMQWVDLGRWYWKALDFIIFRTIEQQNRDSILWQSGTFCQFAKCSNSPQGTDSGLNDLKNEFRSVFDCINIWRRGDAEKGREQKSTHSHTPFPGRADNNPIEFAPCFVFLFYGNSDAQSVQFTPQISSSILNIAAWFMRFGHNCFERDYVFFYLCNCQMVIKSRVFARLQR